MKIFEFYNSYILTSKETNCISKSSIVGDFWFLCFSTLNYYLLFFFFVTYIIIYISISIQNDVESLIVYLINYFLLFILFVVDILYYFLLRSYNSILVYDVVLHWKLNKYKSVGGIGFNTNLWHFIIFIIFQILRYL